MGDVEIPPTAAGLAVILGVLFGRLVTSFSTLTLLGGGTALISSILALLSWWGNHRRRKAMAHRRTASDVDLIQNVRTVPEAEQKTFTDKRRAHIEEQCETLRQDLRENPNPRRSRIGRHINDVIVGGIDRAGMAGAYGLLRMRGYHSMHWDTPAGRLHALSAAGSGALPPLVICSGLGSNSTDYIALLFRLHGSFRRVTVVELPGHGYSTAAAEFNEQAVVFSYQKVLDQLTEQEPVFLVGHSLGGRMALDYVTGRGRTVAPPPPSGAPFTYHTGSAHTGRAGHASAPHSGLPTATEGAALSGAGGPSTSTLSAIGTQPNAAVADAAAAGGAAQGAVDASARPSAAYASTGAAAGVTGATAAAGPGPWQTDIPALMRRRVRAVVLVAAMGAPFSESDVQKLRELYTCEHFRQAVLIQKGAMGTTMTDPIMAGATFKRMRKPAVQSLIRSELMSSCVPVEELRAVAVPTLLMWGGNDRLVPPEHLQHFARALPDAAIIKLLPRMSHNNFAMGHGPAVRQLQRFAERVMVASDPAAATAAHLPPPAAVEALAARADTRDHVATYHGGALADVPEDVAAVVAAAAPPRLHVHRPSFLSHHGHRTSGSGGADSLGSEGGSAVSAAGVKGVSGGAAVMASASTAAAVVDRAPSHYAGAAGVSAGGPSAAALTTAVLPGNAAASTAPQPAGTAAVLTGSAAAVPAIEELPPPNPPHAVTPARPQNAGGAGIAAGGATGGNQHAAGGSATSVGSMVSTSSLPVHTAM